MAQPPPGSLPMFSRDITGPQGSDRDRVRERDNEDNDNDAEDHELRGLLSGVQSTHAKAAAAGAQDSKRGLFEWFDWFESSEPWTRRNLGILALILIVLLLGAALVPSCLLSPRRLGCRTEGSSHPNSKFVGTELRSNGTHDFKRTVLIVSIDGLRADYLDRGLTPHLLDISKKGLRAKYMKPIFPTLTFPNHWALMTGLYAESHGIVANNFWDPQIKSEFHYNKESSTWNPRWWLGEPMWETTGRANVISANLMWPGPPKTTSGASPTYFVPWKDKVPLSEKLDQILRWIDMPLDTRPQLITAYEPSLDQAGHLTGPNSKLVNDTLKYVDGFAKDLHLELVARNLTDIVDVIFVSDHGMTDTSHPELVYLDEILGEEGYSYIEHEDGWPSKGFRFSSRCNVTHYLDILLKAAAENPEKFDVFTHESMPEQYHFSNNYRIAPVYVVPKIGYALTTRAEGDDGLSKGNHGYDNDEPSMRAMFVAHGPFSTNVKDVHNDRLKSRSFLPWTLSSFSRRAPPPEGWYTVNKGKDGDDNNSAYVMEGFENVQVYGLVMKLLGLEEWSARNNATKGFWDKYF